MKNPQKESGQALVEMALVLPILLLLLFGIIEMTMIGFTYITIQNAVSAGANMAVIGGNDDQVRQAVIDASPGLTASLLDAGTKIEPPTPTDIQLPPHDVTITVTYPVNLIFSVIPGLPNPLNVVATLTEGVP